MYTLGRMLHSALYSYAYIIYSILSQSWDKGLSNKPSYIFSTLLGPEICIKQSKCSKHLKGFLRHYRGNCTLFEAVLYPYCGKHLVGKSDDLRLLILRISFLKMPSESLLVSNSHGDFLRLTVALTPIENEAALKVHSYCTSLTTLTLCI